MRDFKIYLTIASLLLILYVVTQYNKPRQVNWQPTLYFEDKIPFGTYIFYHRLNDIFPGAEVVNTNQSMYGLFSKPKLAGNYFIVAKQVKLTKNDYTALVRYVKAGNSVFIASFSWAGCFKDSLNVKSGIESNMQKTPLTFTNDRLQNQGPYQFDKEVSNQYFRCFDTLRATVITKNNAGNATYISYKLGKGTLLLCANPELFSNYSLLTTSGANYAERALSYLPLSKKIYWDEYQNHDIAANTSPVQVFLNHPALQWGYYLSLGTLLLYVLFENKRRQRIIPVIEPLKNSTVEFVTVVGRVYFEKHDNVNIAHKKILYLLGYLRERYFLKTNKLDSDFASNLAKKTGIGPDVADELVNYINFIGQQTKLADHELIKLNQLIEKFYSQS